MNSASTPPTQAPMSTQLKVGVFFVLSLITLGLVTLIVNDRPYWWRTCQLVHISVDDATGLKTRSPIRSLGLDIGFLESVDLYESHVRLGICITAPVEVLPSTRAYIRGEGFLGDKFVELKPVKYTGERPPSEAQTPEPTKPKTGLLRSHSSFKIALLMSTGLFSSAVQAEEAPAKRPAGGGREIPVGQKQQDMQQLVDQVNAMVGEMSDLTTNLKQAINPEDLRKTLQQMNKALENASKTLSPQGNLTTTAQRSLAKLEDAIEQLRDQVTRINQGKGSVGRILNDDEFADEIKSVLKNINQFLGRVDQVRFQIDTGVAQIPAYDGTRAWFKLQIFPRRDRYYLVGFSVDPRGKPVSYKTVTSVGGQTYTVDNTIIEQGGFVLSGMLGKIFFNRLDLSAGILHGDGTVAVGLALGPDGNEELVSVKNELYSRFQGGTQFRFDDRLYVSLRPWMTLHFLGGMDSFRRSNNLRQQWAYFVGAGVVFDDNDIKLLFPFLN